MSENNSFDQVKCGFYSIEEVGEIHRMTAEFLNDEYAHPSTYVILGKPDPFGEQSMFDNNPKYNNAKMNPTEFINGCTPDNWDDTYNVMATWIHKHNKAPRVNYYNQRRNRD